MTVAIYISSRKDAANMIPWGIMFAHADHADLLVVCPKRSTSEAKWEDLSKETETENLVHQAVFESIENQDRDVAVLKEDISKAAKSSSNLDRVAITVREISARSPEESFAADIDNSNVSLLLLSADDEISAQNSEPSRR